ncbi:MAG TPA: helix-turn-helix transcriptional regulator, partial [Marmoricola sp.]|nr:helix-turn-helix transcriptional regulator [Marmoricola sp.]
AERRAPRLYAAARCSWLTGQPQRARALADAAKPQASDPGLRADIARLRARIEWNTGSVQLGHRMILQAAQEVAPTDPVRAREMAMFAAALATFGGDSGIGIDPVEFVGDPGPGAPARERWFADLVLGLDHVRHGRWAEAQEVLGALMQAAQVLAEDDQDLLPNLGIAALHLGDDEASYRYHELLLSRARDTGAMVMVLYSLTRLLIVDVATGRWPTAEARAAEAVTLAEETGQPVLGAAPRAWQLLLAAHRGDDQYDRLLTEVEAGLTGQPVGILDGAVRDVVRWAKGVRAADNPAAAFHQFGQLSLDLVRRLAAVDRVEAAVRAEQTAAAQLWVEDLGAFATATGRPWAAAAAAHGRALTSDPADAERHFQEALAHHASSPRAFDRARTELAYGEHLRRQRRRVDAREHLRSALSTFEDLEARPWAERAAQELRASGETARKRDVTETTKLTPQEMQVATLVSGGLSNREVAAQLFLSPRTIDFHLRNVFAKTGVTSRVELARLPLG